MPRNRAAVVSTERQAGTDNVNRVIGAYTEDERKSEDRGKPERNAEQPVETGVDEGRREYRYHGDCGGPGRTLEQSENDKNRRQEEQEAQGKAPGGAVEEASPLIAVAGKFGGGQGVTPVKSFNLILDVPDGSTTLTWRVTEGAKKNEKPRLPIIRRQEPSDSEAVLSRAHQFQSFADINVIRRNHRGSTTLEATKDMLHKKRGTNNAFYAGYRTDPLLQRTKRPVTAVIDVTVLFSGIHGDLQLFNSSVYSGKVMEIVVGGGSSVEQSIKIRPWSKKR